MSNALKRQHVCYGSNDAGSSNKLLDRNGQCGQKQAMISVEKPYKRKQLKTRKFTYVVQILHAFDLFRDVLPEGKRD